MIPYYRLFFQLTRLFNCDSKDITDREFVFKIKEYFSLNLGGIGLGIGNLCKNLSDKFEFNDENIEKVYQIMQNHNLKTIETVHIAKKCKTTGIISFLVKDALVYSGLDLKDQKVSNPENYNEKKFIIEHNMDFKDMLKISKKTVEKLEEIMTKFQY